MPGFQPKACAGCGQEYVPTNGNQKRCPECRAAIPAPAVPPAPVPAGEVIEGMVVKPKSRKQWAAIIRHDLRDAIQAIVATGRHLIAAKADLPHGEWQPFCLDDLHISPRTAECFMRIGANTVFANPQHVAVLPSAWGTLAELDRMPGATLQKAIEAGHVRPDMERSEAARVRKAYQDGDVASLDMPKPPPLPKEPAGAWQLVAALTALDAEEEAARYPQPAWVLELADLLRWAAAALRARGVEASEVLAAGGGQEGGVPWAAGAGEAVVSLDELAAGAKHLASRDFLVRITAKAAGGLSGPPAARPDT